MTTPIDSDVYYHGIYWNSYESVIQHLNRRAYDGDAASWGQYVRSTREAPFERALSLNCGTAWMERDLLAADLVRSVVGVDYMDDLLQLAREASVGLPIEYVQMDTNLAVFPPGPFDVVLNHAAGHHITAVDRVFRAARDLLPSDGALLTWDYTGPHRNQYGTRIWNAARAVNATLPAAYRADMGYAHLPTMLVTDPTEAVHSELLLETMDRYFEVQHIRRLGGPIAYVLLTHNAAMYAAPSPLREELIEQILAADVAHVEEFPEDNLFTFAICTPRAAGTIPEASLRRWEREEADREEAAAANGGRYYLPTAIERAVYPRVAAIASVDADFDANDVARRGIRLSASALVRAVASRVPFVVPLLHRLNRARRRAAGVTTDA